MSKKSRIIIITKEELEVLNKKHEEMLEKDPEGKKITRTLVLEPTKEADQLQVLSEKTYYLYGEEAAINRSISMDEFLLEILERIGGITQTNSC